MDKSELLKLADRIEALQVSDREMDDTIAEALFTGKHRVCVKGLSDEAGGMWMFTYPDGSIGSSLRFTGSLDAAMTLVPEGWEFSLDNWSGSETFGPCVCDMGDDMRPEFNSEAKTLALALCAASLRALAKEDS